MRRLIINADDFGEAAFRGGVLEAYRHGVVTSASVLANADDAAASVAEAKAQGLPLGLHLNLTEGPPLSAVPTLTAEGVFLGKESFRKSLEEGRIDPAEIRREVEAQLRWFTGHAGTPSHLDGHHHVHVLPEVLVVAAPLVRECGTRFVRVPAPLPGSREMLPVLREYGLAGSDHFVGFGIGWDLCTPDAVEAALRSLPEGVTEYMVHLMHPADIPRSPAAAGRAREFTTLTLPRIMEVLREENIALTSYADL